MDPLTQMMSPQSLAGIMQQLQMKKLTEQQQQAAAQPGFQPQQQAQAAPLGLWGVG